MDKKSWIGFLLIAVIIIGFSLLQRPSKEQLAAQQAEQDSIARVEAQKQAEQAAAAELQQVEAQSATEELTDSARAALAEEEETKRQDLYRAFAVSSKGTDSVVVLENEKIRLNIHTKGGCIARAELKGYHAYGDSVNPLRLFGAEETMTSLTFAGQGRTYNTQDLYFAAVAQTDSSVIMRLRTSKEDSYIDFVYALNSNDYMVNWTIRCHNTDSVLAQNNPFVDLVWQQVIPQHERGRKFEDKYAQLQYRLCDGDMEELSATDNDDTDEQGRLRWIGYKDQFFSTVLIADCELKNSTFRSTMMDSYSGYIKEYTTQSKLTLDFKQEDAAKFRYYFGPNQYSLLKSYDKNAEDGQELDLQELVPLGWKIVSWINKILVIPMFDLFSSWQLNIGLIIILMTLVIKLIILPFVFVSYRSSAKMRVLRPQIEEINAKYPADKMQERQAATMQLYNRAGASPMSGCLPMLFQFPVLMAMFWFLPTAIELRGQSFLWADDLSTYDTILSWNAHIPLLGDHLSLFCLLMTVVNVAYTYLNMQTQPMDPNMKFMKWMMYLMPVFFLFIFNDYASGLSFYYFVSLLMTILQTFIFRWAIDDKKLLAEMEANAKKKEKSGKKKSGWMERLEKMQREQQRMARENAKAQSRKMR